MSDEKYDIGYKKPPKNTQFKPGQSGNPAGRPKGLKNLSTDLSEELAEKISVTEGGKQTHLTKQRAMVKTLVAKAMKGEPKSADVIIKMLLGIEQASANTSSPETLCQEDQDVLLAYQKRILSKTDSEDTNNE